MEVTAEPRPAILVSPSEPQERYNFYNLLDLNSQDFLFWSIFANSAKPITPDTTQTSLQRAADGGYSR